MTTSQLTRADTAEHAGQRSERVVAAPASGDLADAIALARREAWQLPVLRQDRAIHRPAETWEGVHVRLQAALGELAARADIPVAPGASVDSVARLLVGYGAIIPPAGDGVRALAAVAHAGGKGRVPGGDLAVEEAALLAERLAGYLALRTRFG